ncbi:hypothetical protein P3T76_003381 [Phytophthora citrophthora]|uniref:Uncharacterized protein n=1 Tax=Phytophthora citrophthora TaxID=4793 RepID=A0AAD9GV76_9STRA|nr:hypothetical protein P3T76_003381 [Phytophthora citrophthora]
MVKDGDAKTRREHVEHFLETLRDTDLADQLRLLRLADADELEDVLQARDREIQTEEAVVRIQRVPAEDNNGSAANRSNACDPLHASRRV